MVVSVCPVDIVAAPVDGVWELLTQTSKYDRWWDAQLVRSVPEGPAVPGQVVHATSRAFGKQWDVTFVIEMVNHDRHQIKLDVTLPFGIVDHATITCTLVDESSCQVQYG